VNHTSEIAQLQNKVLTLFRLMEADRDLQNGPISVGGGANKKKRKVPSLAGGQNFSDEDMHHPSSDSVEHHGLSRSNVSEDGYDEDAGVIEGAVVTRSEYSSSAVGLRGRSQRRRNS